MPHAPLQLNNLLELKKLFDNIRQSESYGITEYIYPQQNQYIMKTTTISLLTLGIFAMAIASCKKKDEKTPVSTGSATVEGYIKINLNERNDTLPDGSYSVVREGLPSTVKLTFKIDSKDLDKDPDPNYTYDIISRIATVDASGHYVVSLPTPSGSNAISGELKISDFEYNPIITSSQDTDSSGARVVVTSLPLSFSIYNGGTTILDHNF
jgi:hypothetical protein